MVDVSDAIKPFKFGDDRFKGFGLAEGQNLHFPIDLKGRLYNTHTTNCVRCDDQKYHLICNKPTWRKMFCNTITLVY